MEDCREDSMVNRQNRMAVWLESYLRHSVQDDAVGSVQILILKIEQCYLDKSTCKTSVYLQWKLSNPEPSNLIREVSTLERPENIASIGQLEFGSFRLVLCIEFF